MFSGHKYMTDMEKGITRTLNDNNIPTRKIIYGWSDNFHTKKDVGNYYTEQRSAVKLWEII